MIQEFQDRKMPVNHQCDHHCLSHNHLEFIEYILCAKYYALALSMHSLLLLTKSVKQVLHYVHFCKA